MTLRAQVLTRWPTLPVWTNSRLAKSADYTVANSDKGKTIALGTGFFTLTFSAASGYDAVFAVLLVNESTTRGKKIVLTGGTTFILWPEQSCFILNDNNVWKVEGKPNRWKFSSSVIFYAAASGGSNANDGLSAGSPFATIQKIIDTASFDCDANGKTLAGSVADGTYNEDLVLRPVLGVDPGGWATKQLLLQGNITTLGNVILNSTNGCVTAVNVQTGWLIEGFEFRSGNYGVESDWGAVIYLGNNKFTAMTHKILAAYRGRVEIVAAYTDTGNASTHWRATDGGMILVVGPFTLTITGTPVYGTWAYVSGQGSRVIVAGVTFSGSVTGIRFQLLDGSIETFTSGDLTYLPGSIAGVFLGDGEYDGVMRGPAAALGWVVANAAGTAYDAHGVTSIVDPGVGGLTVNWSKSFATVRYVPQVSVTCTLTSLGAQISTIGASSLLAIAYTLDAPALTDPDYWHVVAFGRN